MFERSWPKDLPGTCPDCGKVFQSNVNLSIGPGKASRRLKGLAYGMVIPWMIIAIVAIGWTGIPLAGRASGYAIVGIIFLPPALLALLSSLLPISRRVICTCGWQMESGMGSKPEEVIDGAH